MVSGWMPIFRDNFTGMRVAPELGILTNPAGMNTLTHAIIGCGIRVHREIGPGVLENVYNECMQYELRQEGLRFDRERAVPLVYKGQKLISRYYIDLVVEDRVMVELKTVVEIVEIHKNRSSLS